jgi:hypothetical protein
MGNMLDDARAARKESKLASCRDEFKPHTSTMFRKSSAVSTAR